MDLGPHRSDQPPRAPASGQMAQGFSHASNRPARIENHRETGAAAGSFRELEERVIVTQEGVIDIGDE